MIYLDVTVTVHSTDGDINAATMLMPPAVAALFKGWNVRSSTVIDASTGLLGTFRNDKVQGRINREMGK